MITGTASRETIRAINVAGTLNAFDAAAGAGAGRFVYASSVAAYGFHPDNPIGMTEDWPTRPATRLFYAQEKAELEQLLREQADAHPAVALYLLRPPIVLGPHAIGAKNALPEPLASLAQRALDFANRLPVPIPVPTPDLPMQFIHEDDVGQALLRCVVADGPAGAYNIAGDGIVTAADVVRELGFTPITVPAGIAQGAARAAASFPLPSFAPPADRVGRGRESPRDHGHDQGQARARLAAQAHAVSTLCAKRSAASRASRARPTRPRRHRAGCRR